MVKVSIREASILLCLIICSIAAILGSFGIFAKQFTVGKIVNPDNTIKCKPAHIGVIMSSYDPQCGNTTLPGYKQLSPTNTFFLLFPFRQVFGGALPTSLKSFPQLNTFSNCTKYPTDLYNLAYSGSTLVDLNNYFNTVIYQYLRYWNSSTLSIILNTYLTTLTFPTDLSTLTQADIKRINTSVQRGAAFFLLLWAFNA